MDLEGPGSYNDEPITTQTGNDTVTSERWRIAEVAPGTKLKHIVLPATARTVSIGDLNQSHDIGFRWLQPHRNGEPGEACMIKAKAGAHEIVSGLFELWPLRVTALTPERRDDDQIVTARLHHCATPGCSCKLPKLHEFLRSNRLSAGMPGASIQGSSSDGPATIEASAVDMVIQNSINEAQGPGGLEPPPDPHPVPRKRELAKSQEVGTVSVPGAGKASAKQDPVGQGSAEADDDAQAALLKRLKEGHGHAIDESLLPASHLQVHDTSDQWAQFCSTCRAVLQRRKAAKRNSGPYNTEQSIAKAPYGEQLWLDTTDYQQAGVKPIGQFRYDLASWDAGSGWLSFMPIRSKAVPSVTATLRSYRRHSESLASVISDKANELVKAARQENADALPLVPHRPQGNRLEREIESHGDRLKACLIHAGVPPKFRPFASKYVSDVYCLFKQVPRLVGEGEEAAVQYASPYHHRSTLVKG